MYCERVGPHTRGGSSLVREGLTPFERVATKTFCNPPPPPPSIHSKCTRGGGRVHGPCRELDCLRTLKGARGDSGGGGERTMFINAVYGTHIFHGHSKSITWRNNAFKNIKRPFHDEVYTNQVYLGLCVNMYVLCT